MYRCFYDSRTLKVLCYERAETAPIKTNSFIIDELPTGDGAPYVNLDTKAIYFIAQEPELLTVPDPPLENYLVELDFRLSLIELGVN